MKKRVIAIISIILAVIIAVVAILLLLSQCGGKKVITQVVVKPNSSEQGGSDDDTSSTDDDPFMSDDITLDSGFTDYVTYKPADLSESETELYVLKANNSDEHIATSLYRGLTGSVYWPTEFLDQRAHKQSYTDEMIDKEFQRFKDLGLRVLRTGFWSDWMYTGNPDDPWDANTKTMQEFYDFCRAAAEYDLTVAPLMAWSYPNFLYGGGQYLSEVGFMYPRAHDENGNTIVVERWGVYFEEPDVELMNERFSSWVVATVQGFEDNGIENVDFIFFGNEPHEDGGTATGAFVDYQIGTFSAAHKALKKAGLRDNVKLIGPNQSCVTPRAGLAVAFMDRAPDVFDIYSSHFSAGGQTAIDDVYERSAEVYDGWMDKMDDHELVSVKEFWGDEFNGNADGYGEHGTIDPWTAIQIGCRFTAATNAGLSGSNFWQIFDQLWPNYYGSGGEYLNGAQMDGSAQSFYQSETPYPTLYGISIMSKYMGSNTGIGYGTSYRCESMDDTSGLYITMVQRGDGEWSVLVVNMSTDPRSYQIEFEESMGGVTMYRYKYNVAEVEAATNFKVPTADKGFTNVENTLIDSVQGGTICVYSTIKDIAE